MHEEPAEARSRALPGSMFLVTCFMIAAPWSCSREHSTLVEKTGSL